jgi:CrcB protein
MGNLPADCPSGLSYISSVLGLESKNLAGQPLDVLVAISAGGVCGALARYGIALALPHSTTAFPLSTFLINVIGCALMGLLMGVIVTRPRLHRLVRPFVGVGILGGFTTFSTYILDIYTAATHGKAALALGYLAASLICCLLACAAAFASTEKFLLKKVAA